MRNLYKPAFLNLLSFIFIIFTPCFLKSSSLTTLIKERKYEEIKLLFKDNSYEKLLKFLKEYKIVKIKERGEYGFSLIVLKKDRGEIINFNLKKGKESKYKDLTYIEVINPFYIIGEKIKKYIIRKKEIRIGDSVIAITKAELYLLSSSFYPIILKGKIKIRIAPSDREERKHFIHLFKKPYKDFKVKWTIISAFYYKEQIKNIINSSSPLLSDYKKLDKKILKKFYGIFGFKVEGIDRRAFLLNERDDNLVIFPFKTNKIMAFKFNRFTYPDTQLFGLNFNKILLDYSSLKTFKILTDSSISKISGIDFNILFSRNIEDYFARETIIFKEKINKLSINLPKFIKITNISSKNNSVSYYRALNKLFIKSKFPMDSIKINFSAHYVKKDELDFYSSDKKLYDERFIFVKKPFYFFGRDSNYYLKDSLDFFKFKLNYRMPGGLRCFGGGEKIGESTFSSDAIKGMPLVCGEFVPVKRVKEGNLIFNVFSDFIPNNSVKKGIGSAPFIYKILKTMFGPLNCKNINIILTHSDDLSGTSYQELLILKIPKRKKTFYYPSSPVKFTIDLSDFLTHEIAHQWWGGIISWASFRDIWFTEGFSQFSILEYAKMKDRLLFRKIIKDMNKSVKKYFNYGPLFYGKRVGNWEEKPKAYFSIIYNKSALVLYMLKELMGEDIFFTRVREVLKKNRYKSITTATFIYEFTKDKPLLNKFFRDWVFRRELPVIHYKISSRRNKIQIELKQLNSEPFIFPLYVKLVYKKMVEIKKLVVKQKKELFKLTLKEKPSSIKIMEDYITPVIVR